MNQVWIFSLETRGIPLSLRISRTIYNICISSVLWIPEPPVLSYFLIFWVILAPNCNLVFEDTSALFSVILNTWDKRRSKKLLEVSLEFNQSSWSMSRFKRVQFEGLSILVVLSPCADLVQNIDGMALDRP